MSLLKKRSGFTLIELLIVIAILAVLISFGLVSFTTVQKRARDAQRKSDMKAVQGALETYYSDYNSYPGSSSGQINDANCGGSSLTWGTSSLTCGGKAYSRQLPKDPQTSNSQYYYTTCNAGQTYVLYSNLELAPTDTQQVPCGALPAGYNASFTP